MHRLGFSIPLEEYVMNGTDGRILQELRTLLAEGRTA
jgi:hypothetical protein